MEFIPNLAVKQEMLAAMGVASLDDLFADVPKAVRIDALDLPPAQSEIEVRRYLQGVLDENRSTDRSPSFVGGSLKEHHVPAFVGHLLSRQEFYTSYTPYQAELSQGTLQALFEFQSMLATLTQLPVANASMYDWSTAIAEAALMAQRVTRRKRILVPRHLAWEKRSTVENYAHAHGMRVVAFDFDHETGASDPSSVAQSIDEETAGVYLENPNLFGVWETAVAEVAEAAHDAGALLIQGFDLSSLGLVEPPGALGADIAVGDGTTFCFPPSLGGPQLGLFAARKELARLMPGRIIGASRDRDGGRAYCMTLQTREQHIRRDKATSNICTNQSLLAVGVGAHLAALGPQGIQELGALNAQSAARLARRVENETPWQRAFNGPFYNEVALDGPMSGEALFGQAGAAGLTPGYPVARSVEGLDNVIVACSTEVHTPADHDRYVQMLQEVSA